MINLCVIGSSEIIEDHLKVARKLKFKLHSIASTKKNSKNSYRLYKKYKFENHFDDWRLALLQSKKIKNIVYLIAPRISDTIKVLNHLQPNSYALVEKPLSLASIDFDKIKKKNLNLMIGYNRVFYKSVHFLKNKSINNSIVNVNLVEKNLGRIKENSCHIISLLLHVFGDLKLKYKLKKQYYIFCSFSSKDNNIINLSFCYNLPNNFSIEILNRNSYISQKPIEKIYEVKQLKILKKKNQKFFKPQINFSFEENYIKFKPGFYKQMLCFKKNVISKNKFKINNINFGKKVMKICEQITQ